MAVCIQLIQSGLNGIERCYIVNAPQVRHESLLVFLGNVLHRVTSLVDHTVLNVGIGVDAFNSLRKALQAVYAGDQDVFNASVMQIGQDAQPVTGAFLIGEFQNFWVPDNCFCSRPHSISA